jgi:transcriptional regulator with XRE-family HTH domain
MTSREHPQRRAALRARHLLLELGLELREARLSQGRTLVEVARAAGISRSQLSRVELAESPTVSFLTFVTLAVVLGMDFHARLYAGQRRLRDGPQLALLRALRDYLGPDWVWRYEALVATGDQRAWDARATHVSTGLTIVIEAETRIRDVQALVRRIELKRSAAGAPRVVLLVAGTRTNRLALDAANDVIGTMFPVDTRAALRALGRGLDPGADCLIRLTPAASTVTTGRDPLGADGKRRPIESSSPAEGP